MQIGVSYNMQETEAKLIKAITENLNDHFLGVEITSFLEVIFGDGRYRFTVDGELTDFFLPHGVLWAFPSSFTLEDIERELSMAMIHEAVKYFDPLDDLNGPVAYLSEEELLEYFK